MKSELWSTRKENYTGKGEDTGAIYVPLQFSDLKNLFMWKISNTNRINAYVPITKLQQPSTILQFLFNLFHPLSATQLNYSYNFKIKILYSEIHTS